MFTSCLTLLFQAHLRAHPETKPLLPRSHLMQFPTVVPENEDGHPESHERWTGGSREMENTDSVFTYRPFLEWASQCGFVKKC